MRIPTYQWNEIDSTMLLQTPLLQLYWWLFCCNYEPKRGSISTQNRAKSVLHCSIPKWERLFRQVDSASLRKHDMVLSQYQTRQTSIPTTDGMYTSFGSLVWTLEKFLD